MSIIVIQDDCLITSLKVLIMLSAQNLMTVQDDYLSILQTVQINSQFGKSPN